MMDFTFAYGPALSYLSEEDQQKYSAEFKKYLQKTWRDDVTHKEWKGYYLLPAFEPATAQFAYNQWNPNKGDVIVASYAKTGTTWMRELARHILYCNDDAMLKKTKYVNFFFTYLEFGPESKYEVLEKLNIPQKVMGTHLPAPLINFKKFKEKGTKIIYMIRNPKDQAVSWYHFCRTQPFADLPPYKDMYTPDKKIFFDTYFAGEHKLFAKKGEGYLEHLKEWYPHQNDSNVLFVYYEDLKKDITQGIRKVAKFLDVALSDEDVDMIAEKTSFNSMKKSARQTEKSRKQKVRVLKLLRKGTVGEWRDYLTFDQSKLIDEKVQKILGDTNLKFVYDLDNTRCNL
ncbi:amine sulfotransferase-like [Clavelina lepadiformis]|uniref:Sulfotransferase n=1 Tax=Clavelina lepadiformis TaxID=159417 RepID=A0ABP0GQ87_CLALP